LFGLIIVPGARIMLRFVLTLSTAALSTALLFSSPALAAGKADRARAAIAEATGKVDAAAKVGTGGDAPRLNAEASAMLRQAKQNLASGHKEEAFDDANRASQLADTAIGVSQRARTEGEKTQRANAEASAAVAQQDAAAANARADAAQQAAAASAADAAAARATPPVVIAAPAPAPASTTITTAETVTTPAAVRQATAKRTVKRRVVRHTAPRTKAVVTRKTTTTTVTTNAN
jgi:hypothetical protein